MSIENHEEFRSRRELLRWTGSAGSAAVLAALAGCSGGTNSGDSGDGGDNGSDNGDGSNEYAPIETWSKEQQAERRQIISPMVEEFDQADVQIEFFDEDNIPEELSAARAAGDLPNVLQVQAQTIQNLGNEGVLSTESAQAVIDAIGMDDLRDGALEFMTTPEGEYFAVPHDGWVQGIWYRQSKFDELGLPEPTTWENIREAAEALHDPDNNQYGIGLGTENANFTRQAFTPIAISNGARVFNEAGEIVFDSPEMVEALEFYVDLAQNYGHPGKHVYDATRQTYVNENSHMIMWSSYIIDDLLEAEMADDTAFAPYVRRDTDASYGQVTGFGITESGDDAVQRTAEAFTEYMFQPDQYVEWLHMAPGGMQSVRQSVSESDAYQDNEVLTAWEDTVATISSALDNVQRFGFVNGQSIPEFGQIASQLLVAEAVVRVYEGEDAETVASEQAEAMRQAIE
ncbi:extracellular solute-binding protein [Halorubrum sp. RMP-47]|uniref:Extracellular solute-binding protein n=1 Tax=Halorubrum miltondacostae TaxID=3076378 RepID=A0ABD5M5N8_9EURY